MSESLDHLLASAGEAVCHRLLASQQSLKLSQTHQEFISTFLNSSLSSQFSLKNYYPSQIDELETLIFNLYSFPPHRFLPQVNKLLTSDENDKINEEKCDQFINWILTNKNIRRIMLQRYFQRNYSDLWTQNLMRKLCNKICNLSLSSNFIEGFKFFITIIGILDSFLYDEEKKNNNIYFNYSKISNSMNPIVPLSHYSPDEENTTDSFFNYKNADEEENKILLEFSTIYDDLEDKWLTEAIKVYVQNYFLIHKKNLFGLSLNDLPTCIIMTKIILQLIIVMKIDYNGQGRNPSLLLNNFTENVYKLLTPCYEKLYPNNSLKGTSISSIISFQITDLFISITSSIPSTIYSLSNSLQIPSYLFINPYKEGVVNLILDSFSSKTLTYYCMLTSNALFFYDFSSIFNVACDRRSIKEIMNTNEYSVKPDILTNYKKLLYKLLPVGCIPLSNCHIEKFSSLDHPSLFEIISTSMSSIPFITYSLDTPTTKETKENKDEDDSSEKLNFFVPSAVNLHEKIYLDVDFDIEDPFDESDPAVSNSTKNIFRPAKRNIREINHWFDLLEKVCWDSQN